MNKYLFLDINEEIIKSRDLDKKMDFIYCIDIGKIQVYSKMIDYTTEDNNKKVTTTLKDIIDEIRLSTGCNRWRLPTRKELSDISYVKLNYLTDMRFCILSQIVWSSGFNTSALKKVILVRDKE